MNSKEKEIRRLLDLYYSGATTRDEERELSAMLRDAGPLSPDLEREREIFEMLSDDEETPIPASTDRRILDAVEGEIRQSRIKIARRRLWLIIGSAAACILAGLLVARLLVDTNAPQKKPLYVKVETRSVIEPDTAVTIVSITDEEGKVFQKKIVTSSKEKEEAPVMAQAPKEPSSSKAWKDSKNEDDGYYLSAEEERMLEAGNYRVVNDEREAYAILNSVFTRLDGNMTESSHRVKDINDEYVRAVKYSGSEY